MEVGAQRPFKSVYRFEQRQRSPGVAAEQQQPRALERELAVELWQPPLEQVVDARAQPVGDDAEHPGRGLRAAQLDLVQERAAEVVAHHLGQAHASLLAKPLDALPERLAFRLDSCHEIMVKRSFTERSRR